MNKYDIARKEFLDLCFYSPFFLFKDLLIERIGFERHVIFDLVSDKETEKVFKKDELEITITRDSLVDNQEYLITCNIEIAKSIRYKYSRLYIVELDGSETVFRRQPVRD